MDIEEQGLYEDQLQVMREQLTAMHRQNILLETFFKGMIKAMEKNK